RRQRDGIEIVAEADRGDVVDRHLDIVRGEIAQARRHHADEAVEHHLEHRQALIRDERGIDDGADAGIFLAAGLALAEAEQAVDFVLIEDAGGPGLTFGAGFAFTFASGIALAAGRSLSLTRIALGHRRPFGGELLLFGLRLILLVGHSVNSRRSAVTGPAFL